MMSKPVPTVFQPGDLSATGQWRRWRGGRTIYISCTRCAQRLELGPDDYWVLESGVVKPAVECDCGFHDYIQLKDWEERQ